MKVTLEQGNQSVIINDGDDHTNLLDSAELVRMALSAIFSEQATADVFAEIGEAYHRDRCGE